MIPMPDDYTVRLVDMPVSQGGMISEDPDGHINVYINARLSDVGQHTAAYHEWEHWYNDDLNNDTPIQTVEKAGRLPKLMRARDMVKKAEPRAELNTLRRIWRDALDWRKDPYLRLPEM